MCGRNPVSSVHRLITQPTLRERSDQLLCTTRGQGGGGPCVLRPGRHGAVTNKTCAASLTPLLPSACPAASKPIHLQCQKVYPSLEGPVPWVQPGYSALQATTQRPPPQCSAPSSCLTTGCWCIACLGGRGSEAPEKVVGPTAEEGGCGQ